MNNQQVENNNLTNEINDLEPPRTEEIEGGQTSAQGNLAQPTGNTSTHGDVNRDGTVTGSDIIVWR